ncbi:alpha/beta fold hydrolase [Pseudomonas sp. NFX224]|uniref:alpha/beta fold hydrolase n=1 Tax=Pseudomonas sp. NFX224 TaxID=3402862 RepID=UPI003AFA4BED
MPSDETPESPPVTAWFDQAIARPPEIQRVDAAGAEVEILTWGPIGAPGLLFVHGMVAHAWWWSYIAPYFATEYRCAALSFSGMGHSGWRERYTMRDFTREITAAIKGGGLDRAAQKPIVVAHSFGAFVARRFAEWNGGDLAGLVMIDSRVCPGSDPAPPLRSYVTRSFASQREAVARFRLTPPQTCAIDYLVDWVARKGLRESEEGWCWSFDPDLSAKFFQDGSYHPGLGPTACPVAFVWGADSHLVSPRIRNYCRDAFPRSPRIEIPQAGHHIMMEQPIALICALRGLFASWPAG